jgi:hypothetical protein
MDQLDSSIGFLFWFFPFCAFLPFVLNVRFGRLSLLFTATIYALATAPIVHFFFFFQVYQKKKKPKTKKNPTVGLK